MRLSTVTTEKAEQRINRQQGFTLIELLVALGVAAVIAVLSYQSINSMVNVKQSVGQQAKQSEQLQRVFWHMRQDFMQLTPRTVLDELGSMLPAFQYRVDRGVEFSRIAQFATRHASGGLLRVGYRLEGGNLYRLTWPVLDRAPDTLPSKKLVLQDVEAFEVELLAANRTWLQDWPSREQTVYSLPLLSRITIRHKEYGTISRLFMGVS